MTPYLGNIHNMIFDVFQKKDGFSVGEKFTAIEKLLPSKKYFYASDKELYEAMEKYKLAPLDEDEKLSDEEYLGWASLKNAEGKDVKIFLANATLTK